MRYYSYIESEDDVNITKIIYSEKEILEEFWSYWCTEMVGNGFSDLITKEHCISDWCALHWAQPEDVFIFKNKYQGKYFMVNELNMQDPTFNLATVICINDNSIVIDGYVHLERDMVKADV